MNLEECFSVDLTVADNSQEVDIEDTPKTIRILQQFESISKSLSLFKNQIALLNQQIKILEKTVKKEMNHMQKELNKNKKKVKKIPSGFAKPTKVTNELCSFMNKEIGSELARTDVTKTIIDYIHKNNLQFSENKQIIIPDEKLKSLLGTSDKDKVTYFTLQKHMNKHFLHP
jgi:chromatin remodeling complex protein RSC6